MGGGEALRCMVVLDGIEKLSVGQELNDFGQERVGHRCRHRFVSTVYLRLMNLAECHVPGSKDTYYIPDFVTTDEETYLLRKVSWQNPLNHPFH